MVNSKKEKGFIAFYLTVLVLALMLSIGVSIFIVTGGEQKILTNITKSNQAYFTAEAGIEDALLRLAKGMHWEESSYPLNVANSTATVEISDIIGGSRTITSNGDAGSRIRKIQIVYQVSSEEVSFHYGAQIGDGGMEMGNNAEVKGNVFSNGSVIVPTGSADISDSIIVARSGNKIEGLNIGGNAKTDTCEDSAIVGNLTYVSGGSVVNCTVGGAISTQPNEIEAQDLPIPQSQIDEWKSEASCNNNPECIIEGDYVLDGKVTGYLGPKKIAGNMLLDNKAILIMTGTIWVVGDVTVRNGAGIKLDPASYGGLSGILITDGKIHIKPGVLLGGSGEEGSYILLISTNAALAQVDPAIEVDNTTSGGIFYTTQGAILIRNNVAARQVTGYKIYLEQNAVIDYEYGLRDAEFSSGPGGCWKVASWKEIE